LQLKSGKYRINDISGNIEAVLKEENDTLSAVAMTTVLPLVLS